MKLYLVRHGQAVGKEIDRERPLSENGIAQTRVMGTFISRNLRTNITTVYHSTKARAAQTAGTLTGLLPHQAQILVTDGLLPGDDPGIWSNRVSSMDTDTMLVGHLPHLSRLASLLLCWNSEISLIQFDTAAAVCLDNNTGAWLLEWMVSPGSLKQPPSH